MEDATFADVDRDRSASKKTSLRPRELHVGEGYAYATPQAAYKASSAGDTIVVHEGIYSFSGDEFHSRYDEDAPILIEHDVRFVGDGDVTFDIGSVTKGALVTRGGRDADLYVENITFQGAHNGSFNGAGIRHLDGDLTVVNARFLGNQNGILGGGEGHTVRIQDSTFHGNGYSDGKAHAVYINKGAELVVEGSTFTGTDTGHHVKSLAARTMVRDSVLGDGNDTASMAVDVTAGGDVLVENNRIVQAASGDNPNIVYYSAKRGGEPGEVTLSGNEIVNQMDKGTLVGVRLADRPGVEVRLEDNTISDSSGAFQLSESAYTSAGNTLNGETLTDGWFDPDWPILTRDLPRSLGEVPPPAMEDSWPSADGTYLMAGWGVRTLEGTDGRDVLEARQKGLKTLKGGDGDDVYLAWGQSEIVEQAGAGFDWVVKTSGSNGYYMPDHVEGFVIHGASSYSNAVIGNAADNVFVGGTVGGNDFRGKAGDDVMYGGRASGNEFRGGDGTDTYVLDGSHGDYTITQQNWGWWEIGYSDGGTDRVKNVEQIRFADRTVDLAGER